MRKELYLNLLFEEETKNGAVISPTDRGLVRLTKIFSLIIGKRRFYKKKLYLVLDFISSSKTVITISDSNHMYEISKEIARKSARQGFDLAILNDSTIFVLPSESFESGLRRIILLSLNYNQKPKKEVHECISIILGERKNITCGAISFKEFNSVALEVLVKLGVSVIVITLDLQNKAFPKIPPLAGNIVLFEVANSDNFGNSDYLQTRELS